MNVTGISGIANISGLIGEYGQMDCSEVGRQVMLQVGQRVSIFSWGVFLAVCWLFVAHIMQSRASKGKSHLASWHGERWFDVSVVPTLCFLFMASFWLLVYGGFGL